ncbi:hypothetical protein SRABI128_01238 [Microbacterium sp. Bi128]|nr:hypothetical protein SRABI128_01238 [Microbacterium sp. Bi128]
MPLAMQTSTPPMASVMLMTPPKLTFAAKGISWPLSSETVSTTHDSPPYMNALLICCFDIAEVSLPFASVHDGIGTIRSRGKETTVTRRGASEMWTSMLTSLRLPSASGPLQRSPKYCAKSGSHSSVPTMSRFTPPLSSPRSGGTAG